MPETPTLIVLLVPVLATLAVAAAIGRADST
jgi:hypothetical protein